MLENLRHTKKKTFEDKRVIPSKIRRAIRPKALLILRIKGEIRLRDRKRGYLSQEIERKRRNRLLMYIPFVIAYSYPQLGQTPLRDTGNQYLSLVILRKLRSV
jgi:hypothetical protein